MKKKLSLFLVFVLMLGMLSILSGCFIKVSKDDAKEIATEVYGYNTSQVTFRYVKRNSLNATTYYTVIYDVDGYEFTVGINAETGEVFSQNYTAQDTEEE